MSDREDFQAARDAGLKARHETRLARAQTAVPGAAIEAACDLTYLGQQLSENHARLILEAALPHLRPHETREARAIRRELLAPSAEHLESLAGRWRLQMLRWDIGTPEQRGTPQQVAEAWENVRDLRCWAGHLRNADTLLNAPEETP